jgi:hypothetical protein
MTRRTVPPGAPLPKASFTLAAALALICPAQAVFGSGHEGHVVALIAEHYMTSAALTRAGESR